METYGLFIKSQKGIVDAWLCPRILAALLCPVVSPHHLGEDSAQSQREPHLMGDWPTVYKWAGGLSRSTPVVMNLDSPP